MNKVVACGLLLAISHTSQAADDWTFLPVTKDGYTANPTLSVMVGRMSTAVDGEANDSVAGMELSLNCPLLQPAQNKIRQQISVNSFDNNHLQITTLELNPHYVMPLSSGLEWGFGPGIGYVQAETPTAKESMFALQLGASLHYTHMDFLFLGAEARYQLTENETFPASPQSGINNFRVALKVGVNF